MRAILVPPGGKREGVRNQGPPTGHQPSRTRSNGTIVARMAQATSPARAWIGTIVFAAVFAFVKGYEEPTLTRTYGGQYLDYRQNVPGWWPRLTPWRPTEV